LNIDAIPPPANDNVANAMSLDSLPFADTVDRTAATMEPGEPSGTPCGPVGHTAWYAYTASQTQTLFAIGNSSGSTAINVYAGDSLGSLTLLSCGFERSLFRVTAGQTYRIQVGGYDGQDGSLTNFRLDVAPTPSVTIFWNPGDPSAFDTMQFSGSVFDQAGGSIDSEHWDFGDGGTAEGFSAAHRYNADGQYTVHDTVTMTDGRVATGTAVINVKTHDVAITKLTVPQNASVDQTKPITVSVTNNRYPETVQVQLAKSVPGGWLTVGTLRLAVPVGKTVDFKFSYVFTADDASIGKVSFQATAFPVSARDALPADNAITSLATRVK
jgi:phage baseplate assembly protein gpV